VLNMPGQPSGQPVAQGTPQVLNGPFALILNVAQAALLASAGLYVLGFVVVGAYLAKFGVGPLEMWRARYLAAGALCAILSAPSLLCATCVLRYALPLSEGPEQSVYRSRLVKAIAVALAVEVGFALLVVLFVAPERPEVDFWHQLGRCLEWVIMTSLLAGLCYYLLREESGRIRRHAIGLPLYTVAGLMALAAVASFGVTHYGTIVPWFGGGRPGVACIVFRRGEQPTARALGFSVGELRGVGRTERVRVIDESERGYLVTLDAREPRRAVWVARDLVAGVVYERRRNAAAPSRRVEQHPHGEQQSH
jgi:hypothetical protein